MATTDLGLLQRLSRIHDLPSLPDVFFEIERLTQDADASLPQIARVIEQDPPLTARILRIANSAFYRQAAKPVVRIAEAIGRIGLRETRRVCQTVVAMRLLVRPSRLVDHFFLWSHSMAVALAVDALAEMAPKLKVSRGEYYAAGLLHELGALLLDQYVPDAYAEIHATATREGLSVEEIERDVLGLDHGEIGAWLLERWGLPERLVQMVRYHHHPDEAPQDQQIYCEALQLADRGCALAGSFGPGESLLAHQSLVVSSLRDLGMDHRVTDLMASFQDSVDRAGPLMAFVS